jgi:ribosomal protein S18 acetylase RimI-like enzyme
MADARLLDRLAARATAPPAVDLVGAWEVRADPSLPFRRSNSTVPFADGGPFDVDARIDDVEARYRARGLPPRFQISSTTDPEDLDDRLARRGYTVEAPVDILVADIGPMLAAVPTSSNQMSVRVNDVVDPGWIERFADEQATLDRVRAYGRLISERASAHVATVDIGDLPAAIGFGVIASGWVGVFGMATRPTRRRRGGATAVLAALGRHAMAEATSVYLQVETDNLAARRLYESAGFVRNHGYHYRVSGLPADLVRATAAR